jgi:hypothetical protein
MERIQGRIISLHEKTNSAGHRLLTHVIPTTQEAEIRRITVQSQPGPYLKKTLHKKKAGGVAPGIGPEFKPQYRKERKKERKD